MRTSKSSQELHSRFALDEHEIYSQNLAQNFERKAAGDKKQDRKTDPD